jgi:hypothetical protein
VGDIADMYREAECEESWREGATAAEVNLYERLRRQWLQSVADTERKRRVLHKRAKQGIWTQRDGTPIAVKDMTDSHLLAAARMLPRKGVIGPRTLAAYFGPGPSGDAASLAFEQEQRQAFETPVSPFVDLFDDEIKRRGLKGGA